MKKKRASLQDIMQTVAKPVGSALGAAMSIPSRVRGYVADVRRGQDLYSKGYGNTYDTAATVAKAGINGPRHYRKASKKK